MLNFAADVGRSRFGRIFLIVLALFAASVLIIPGPTMGEILNPVALAVCGAVGIVYAPDFLTVIRSSQPTRADWLGAGIAVGWFSSAALKADGILVTLGQYWILIGPSHNLLLLLQAIGGACHLIAPMVSVEGRVTRRATISIGISIGIGCAMSMVLMEAKALHWLDTPNLQAPHDIAPKMIP